MKEFQNLEFFFIVNFKKIKNHLSLSQNELKAQLIAFQVLGNNVLYSVEGRNLRLAGKLQEKKSRRYPIFECTLPWLPFFGGMQPNLTKLGLKS